MIKGSINIFKSTVIFVLVVLFLNSMAIAAKAESKNYETVTLTGYIIDEHCFVKEKDDPGKDTKMCKLMDSCIKGGYGIAVKQNDGSYKFYYFNGKFFTDAKALDGTDGQKIAYDLITASKKEDHLAVTVTGAFSGENEPSIGLQGVDYPVLDVINLREATDEEAADIQKTASTVTSMDNMKMKDMKGSEKQNAMGDITIKNIVIITVMILVVLGVAGTIILKRIKKVKQKSVLP